MSPWPGGSVDWSINHPINQKAVGSIPCKGIYLGCRFYSQSRYVQEATDVSPSHSQPLLSKNQWKQIRSVLKMCNFPLKCAISKIKFPFLLPSHTHLLLNNELLSHHCFKLCVFGCNQMLDSLLTFLGLFFAYYFSHYLKYLTSLQYLFSLVLFKIQLKLFVC